METQEIQSNFQEIRELFKETGATFRETGKKFKDADKRLKQIKKEIDRLGDGWGEFEEYMIEPALIELFETRGISFDIVHNASKSYNHGECMEIGFLGMNDLYALMVERKEELEVNDVDDFVKTLADFKRFFPHDADKRVMGALAAIDVSEDSMNLANHNGLFVIGQSGENLEILNDEDFKPATW